MNLKGRYKLPIGNNVNHPLSKKSYGFLFLIGVLLVILGFAIANGNSLNFHWKWINKVMGALGPYLWDSQNVFIGMSIILSGCLLVGLTARRKLPDYIGGLEFSMPRLQRDGFAFGALVLAAFFYSLPIRHLWKSQYTHWDILFFFISLTLVGVTIHRLDKPRSSSTFHFKKLDVAIVLGLIIFAIGINLIGLEHWKFAFIGDEIVFYDVALKVTNGLEWNLFRVIGHPILDMVYAGLAMKVFGTSMFGWRLGEVIFTSISAGLIYLLGCVMFGRFVGFVSGIVLGSSYYLMTFNRVAKNNHHVVFFAILALLMLALAWRTRKALFVYLTGVAMGFCLYTIRYALIMWLIIALLLLADFFQRPSRRKVLAAVLMAIGLILVVLPGFLTASPRQILNHIESESSFKYEAANMPGTAHWDMADEWTIQSILFFFISNHYKFGHHYISKALLDPITAVLSIIGLSICLFRITRRAEMIIVLLFMLGIVIPAVMSLHYFTLPITRLFLALPAVALAAGLALYKLDDILRTNLRLNFFVVRVLILLLLLLIPIWNVHLLLQDTPDQTPLHFRRWLKVFQEYPNDMIIKIGTNSTDSLENKIIVTYLGRWSGNLLSRYKYLTLDELENKSKKIDFDGRLPIFLVIYEDTLSNVSRALPNNYVLMMDYNQSESKSWIFVPT